MARPVSPFLTDGELRLMNVLWKHGRSLVREIQVELDVDLADSTIRTLLGILEGKGYVRRSREGRGFAYEATVNQVQTRRRLVRLVIKRFFRSPGDLVLNLLDAGDIDERELSAIRQAIRQRERS